ncbi:MAG: glycosyltransferase, partial [Planctomycetota bacterium]
VRYVRGCERGGLIDPSGVALPRLDEVSFDDPASLRQRLRTFLGDPPLRETIAEQQRAWVEARLTYTAGLRRTLARVGRLLREEDRDQRSKMDHAA